MYNNDTNIVIFLQEQINLMTHWTENLPNF